MFIRGSAALKPLPFRIRSKKYCRNVHLTLIVCFPRELVKLSPGKSCQDTASSGNLSGPSLTLGPHLLNNLPAHSVCAGFHCSWDVSRLQGGPYFPPSGLCFNNVLLLGLQRLDVRQGSTGFILGSAVLPACLLRKENSYVKSRLPGCRVNHT